MSSGASFAKKPALCRYFAASGTCFYGSDCQFLHETPRTRGKFTPTNHPSPPLGGENQMDGSNGDQYFSATFGSSNGLGEFAGFSATNARSSPLGSAINGGSVASKASSLLLQHHAGQNVDETGLSDQIAGLSLSTHKPPPSVPSVGPQEFVPKASTPTRNSSGLTHSTSSPAFMTTYGPHGSTAIPSTQSSGGAPTVPTIQHGVTYGGVPFSTNSPLNSPHLSPQGSPLTHRRKSPVPQLPSIATAETNATAMQIQENVGGTTYFYTQEDLETQHKGVILPNFTVYPGILPHVAHMKTKANQPSFFMPDELKMELLNRHCMTMVQIDPEQNPEIPQEVDNYHNLFPLEPPMPHMRKSNTFGYQTTVYKGTSTKDGLTYCLRRIHGYRLMNTKNVDLWKCIDLWKKMQHANIVQLREVFTTKAFGDHSMVFVYDFHPGADTVMTRHFSSPAHINGYSGGHGHGGHRGHHGGHHNHPYDGPHRPYSSDKGGVNGPRQHSGLLPETLLWTYIVQLTSALRTIHAHGLACRVLDPTKILLTDKTRLRLNCVGIFDVLSFDSNQANPLAVIPHYQQEDLMSLGKVLLALSCNSIIGIQRDRLQTSMEIVARNYSSDLKNLLIYLLGNQNRLRSINDVMPMIGARFYTQMDTGLVKSDVTDNELAKEVENGRLFRLVCKLGIINERPEFHMDPAWSETGDRYLLKLFRDYLFHQVDENGSPWIDMAHIIQSLNKLDSGSPEKVCLMSRDEQSVIVVSYAELKQCFESAFSELLQSGAQTSTFS